MTASDVEMLLGAVVTLESAGVLEATVVMSGALVHPVVAALVSLVVVPVVTVVEGVVSPQTLRRTSWPSTEQL